jgi:TPR repeat protein
MSAPSTFRRLLAWVGFPRQQFSLAQAAWINGDWSQAERWAWRATRTRYAAEAYLFLSMLYITRDTPDRRRAFECCKSAAELGSPAGMESLGSYFEEGLAVDKDLESALHWYKEAADRGQVNCQIWIARRLLDESSSIADAHAARRYANLAKRAGAAGADELLARADRLAIMLSPLAGGGWVRSGQYPLTAFWQPPH